MKTPHKHAAIIKAWADGAEIEFKMPNGYWSLAPYPCWWDDHLELRLKQVVVAPNILTFYRAYHSLIGHNRVVRQAWPQEDPDLKLTFDGATGKLKAAEVL